jgi:hypothetical protein
MVLESEFSTVADGGPINADVPRRLWFTPAAFILIPVCLSLLAWTLLVVWDAPGRHLAAQSQALVGFYAPAQVSAQGILLLLAWYGILVSVSMIGWRLGSRERQATTVARTGTATFERRYFLLVLTVATVGIAYSYYEVGSLQSIVDTLTTASGNDLYDSLPQSAGVQTLRYATILAAPIGVYLWRKKAIGLPYMIAALLLLLLDALLAHRLSLFMASVVYLVIWAKSRSWSPRKTPGRPRRWIAAVAIVAILFAVLTALNYFRNANYYRLYGVSNPVAMNVYQIGAYLAVPAQVSLGVSDAVMTGTWEVPGDPADSLDAITPTFLQSNKVSKKNSLKYSANYGYSVTFAPEFFTNSVFADTYADYGVWGWLYTLPLYGFAGYLFARAVRYGAVIAGSGGVIAYCFSEVWRTQIVSYGFVIFLLLLTAVCAYVAVPGQSRGDIQRSTGAATRPPQ